MGTIEVSASYSSFRSRYGGVYLKKEMKRDLIKIISVTVVGSMLVIAIPFFFKFFG